MGPQLPERDGKVRFPNPTPCEDRILDGPASGGNMAPIVGPIRTVIQYRPGPGLYTGSWLAFRHPAQWRVLGKTVQG